MNENENDSEQRLSRYFLFFGIVLFALLYYVTLQPVIGWGDSAGLALASMDLDLKAMLGYPNLRVLSGYLFGLIPFVEHWITQNLTSAFFGVVSLAVFYSILRRLEFSPLASFFAVLILGLSHLFWHLSVISEQYSLTWLFFFLHVYCLVRWMMGDFENQKWVYASFFVIGLGLNNSLFILVLVPAALYLLQSRSEHVQWGRDLCLSGLMFLIGASLFFVLLGTAMAERGVQTVLAQQFEFLRSHYMFFAHPLEMVLEIVRYPLYLFYQYSIFGFALGLFGAWLQWKIDRELFWFFLIPFLLLVVFASATADFRRYYVYSFSFVLFSFWIGEGTDWLVEQIRMEKKEFFLSVTSFLVIVGTPVVTFFCISFLFNSPIPLYSGRALPFRQDQSYFFQPWKVNQDGTRALRDFLQEQDQIHDDSILVTDYTPGSVLRYYQHPRIRTKKEKTFRLKNPSKKYRKNPVQTVRKWLDKRSGTSTSEEGTKPGLFLLGSVPVFQRKKLAEQFEVKPIKMPLNRVNAEFREPYSVYYPLIQIRSKNN